MAADRLSSLVGFCAASLALAFYRVINMIDPPTALFRPSVVARVLRRHPAPDRDAGRETFFIPGREPFRLPPRDPLLYFVERLRDEAHRFAIGSHRTRRKRDIREGGLQEIPGIGPTRKRALLHHFGTLKAIERASLADLTKVPGINEDTAQRIYNYFH